MIIKRSIFHWLPVVLWMGLIFFLSAQPGLKITEGVWDLILRKSAHVFEYAVLFLLFYRAIEGSFKWEARVVYLSSVILAFFYAATDEFHQLFVRQRSGNFVDLGFDFLGILGAVLFIHYLLPRFR